MNTDGSLHPKIEDKTTLCSSRALRTTVNYNAVTIVLWLVFY